MWLVPGTSGWERVTIFCIRYLFYPYNTIKPSFTYSKFYERASSDERVPYIEDQLLCKEFENEVGEKINVFYYNH